MSEKIKEYKTIEEDGLDEIVVKKSRFIANVIHVESEEEALLHIERLKKQYWDARHNCYSFIVGKGSELMRFSDDGEPQGTAGKPILEVLKGMELTNILVVITRYFGGVLLGTGGLVRAYTDATIAGIASTDVCTMKLMQKISVSIDYNLVGKLKFLLANNNISIIDESYTDNVVMTLGIPVDEVKRIVDLITDATLGKAVFEELDMVYVAVRE